MTSCLACSAATYYANLNVSSPTGRNIGEGQRQAETRAARSIHDGQLMSECDDFQVQRNP
jgi:hypothetical protein